MMVCQDKHPEETNAILEMIRLTDERIHNRSKYPEWRCRGCGAQIDHPRCDYCGRLNAYPAVECR